MRGQGLHASAANTEKVVTTAKRQRREADAHIWHCHGEMPGGCIVAVVVMTVRLVVFPLPIGGLSARGQQVQCVWELLLLLLLLLRCETHGLHLDRLEVDFIRECGGAGAGVGVEVGHVRRSRTEVAFTRF
jgi:hypothetical protein